MTLYGVPEQVKELERRTPISDWIIVVSDKPFRNLTAPIEVDLETFNITPTQISHLYEIYRKAYGVQENIVIVDKFTPESPWELKKQTESNPP